VSEQQPTARRERNPMRALTRVLATLAEMDEASIGMRELARRLDTPPSSLQRTLEGAFETSLVALAGPGQWELGWEFHRLAALAQRKQPFRAATDILQALRDATGETALLTVYDPYRKARMFVAAAESHHAVRFVPQLFSWMPAHAGASALAILAFRPEDERRALYADGLTALTATTATSAEDLETRLAKIRRDGYAFSYDEVNLAAAAVAAPVRLGEVTSSVAVIAPRQRFDEVPRAELAGLTVRAARHLAQRLGDPGAALAGSAKA
jgi:IclR family transcriptional regulator, acetate operon repressor